MLMERVLQGSADSEGTSGIRNDVSIHFWGAQEFFLNSSPLLIRQS